MPTKEIQFYYIDSFLRRLFILLVLASLSFSFSRAEAQTIHFRGYSVEDGLPFIHVFAIYQDRKGNLWTGGYGGLSKFDGHTFINFGTKDGLINHNVQTIAEDKEGHLWIGTSKGVSKYDGSSFTNYNDSDGLPVNYVNKIFVDSKDRVIFGTQKGLSIFNESSFNTFTSEDGLISDNILSIVEDEHGNFWLGTDNGLSRFDGTKFENWTAANGLVNNIIKALVIDDSGNIWCGTRGGISILSIAAIVDHGTEQIHESVNSGIINLTTENGLSNNNINALLLDDFGQIWAATEHGLNKITVIEETGSISIDQYYITKETNSNWIESVFLDYEGNIWLGTYGGLFKYRGSPFIGFSEKDGLAHNFIFGIFRDNKHNLWVGSYGGGLHRYDGEKFELFTTRDGLAGNAIWSGLQDSKGNIWIGSDGGISKILLPTNGTNNISFKNYNRFDGLFSNEVFDIVEDSRGRLWLGGLGGVTIYEDGKFTPLEVAQGNIPFQTWAILEDRNHDMWFGTYEGGIYKYDGTAFREISDDLGIYSDGYLDLLEDSKGRIWIATFDGVFMYDPDASEGNKVSSFSTDDGLSSDLVYSLALSKDEKYLWIGTNQGLNKLKLLKFRQTGEKEIEHYGKEEGFLGVECNTNGIHIDDDGTIWFGTVNGMIRYDPSIYYPNNQKPRTNITGFRIFYEDTILPNHARLPYTMNNISFKYSGICLTNPNKVKYQYWLEGFDKNWSPNTKEAIATYSNLPPGKYTFRVISCNNENIWNHEPATFSFVIEAPIWKKTWFLIILVIAFGGLIWMVFYLRIKNLKKKSLLDRKMDQLRAEALRSQMNPHFIFNCMNTIQHYINNNEKKLANIYLSKFAELMRMILDNSQRALIPIMEDIKALELYIELEKLRFENKFDYSIDIDPDIDIDIVMIPPMIIHTYVENAIIHGLLNLSEVKDGKKKKGHVNIKIKLENNHILCIIEDNGVGRKLSAELRKKVGTHTPAGMKITKERLEVLNLMNISDMHVTVTDLFDEDNRPSGTMVEVSIIPDVE